MNTTENTFKMENRQTVLSAIWTFATLNYLYCDVLTVMDPTLLRQFMTGSVNGMQFTPGFLLGAAILVEIPIGMVLLSRVLKYSVNRWANLIAGILMTVVQFSSLFLGSAPASYYIFFSILEIASTAFIVWYAWTWTNPDYMLEKPYHKLEELR